VVIVHDDYNQYYIAVEKACFMETTDAASALFCLVASHYVFNLSYYSKVFEMLHFIQEKTLDIESDFKREGSPSLLYHNHILMELQACLTLWDVRHTVSDSEWPSCIVSDLQKLELDVD